MASKRKLWATRFQFPGAPEKRHPSQPAAYRYVRDQIAPYRCGALRTQHLDVLVDERDGFGWRTFDRIDLADFGVE